MRNRSHPAAGHHSKRQVFVDQMGEQQPTQLLMATHATYDQPAHQLARPLAILIPVLRTTLDVIVLLRATLHALLDQMGEQQPAQLLVARLAAYDQQGHQLARSLALLVAPVFRTPLNLIVLLRATLHAFLDQVGEQQPAQLLVVRLAAYDEQGHQLARSLANLIAPAFRTALSVIVRLVDIFHICCFIHFEGSFIYGFQPNARPAPRVTFIPSNILLSTMSPPETTHLVGGRR
jgi:hypothetical protein